jgi:beta-N-acetylhexosaminidase
LARAGIAGCIKHMPGHGRSRADSHKELPTIEASEEELEADLEPFRTLRDAPIGMTAHLRFTAWDADNPATQSQFVVQEIIRRRIGFTGLLLSDDIYMEALGGSIAERGVGALAAGCDVVLNCHGSVADMAEVADALPGLSDDAANRLGAALANRDESPTGDHALLIAKRDALLDLARRAA